MDAIWFRQRYRPGDIVQGTIVQVENPGQAWIQVGDLQLLARTNLDYPAGQKLFFLVQQLYPQIILKEADQDEIKTGRLNIIV
ncbi:hypothetical protein [Desulfovulcanus sp.]